MAVDSEPEPGSTSILRSGSLSGDDSSFDEVVAPSSGSLPSPGVREGFFGDVVQQEAAKDEDSAPGEGGGVWQALAAN